MGAKKAEELTREDYLFPLKQGAVVGVEGVIEANGGEKLVLCWPKVGALDLEMRENLETLDLGNFKTPKDTQGYGEKLYIMNKKLARKAIEFAYHNTSTERAKAARARGGDALAEYRTILSELGHPNNLNKYWNKDCKDRRELYSGRTLRGDQKVS